MAVITFDSKVFKVIMDRLEFLEKSIKIMSSNNGFSRWMSEEEVMQMTGLKPRTLREKRRRGVFNWTTATGRKIQYLRKDVEGYLDNNSSISIKKPMREHQLKG
ncbi:MAG TPA: helix-turn-helix domain-containing protein [Hanamia sp.]|nr:helix-turn-helix domain-containing protein [Hanamia sp.]